MLWFILCILACGAWALEEVVCKKAAQNRDSVEYTYASGICSCLVVALIGAVYAIIREEEIGFSQSLMDNAFVFVVVGIYYFGNILVARSYSYVDVSVLTFLENSTSVIDPLAVFIAFLIFRGTSDMGTLFTRSNILGLVLCGTGVILLAIGEHNKGKKIKTDGQSRKWYTKGAGALIFTLIFIICDSFESGGSAVLLDTEIGAGMPEGDYLICAGIVCFIGVIVLQLLYKKREGHFYRLFAKSEKWILLDALLDSLGNVFYIYAVAINVIDTDILMNIAAPLTMLSAVILLKEKVTPYQLGYSLLILAGCIVTCAGHFA